MKSTGPFLRLLRFEVTKAKFLKSSSFYDFHYRIFVVFVFDKILKGMLVTIEKELGEYFQ